MALDPSIPLQGREFKPFMPADALSLRTFAQDAQYRRAKQRQDLLQDVLKETGAAWAQTESLPDDERARQYRESFVNAMERRKKTGLWHAAGLDDAAYENYLAKTPPPEVAMSASMTLDQIGAQRKDAASRQAYKFKPGGELDVSATQQALAQADPKAAMQFLRETQQHEARMVSESTQAQELQRRLDKDKASEQVRERSDAMKRGIESYVKTLQAGGTPEEAQAQLRTVAQLPEGAQIDPGALSITDEGDIVMPASGGFVKTATPRPKVAPDETDWQLAYAYSAARLPKFNPTTSPIVIDPRTDKIIENEPVLSAKRKLAESGRQELNISTGAAKDVQKGESALRDDFRQESKVFIEVRNAYTRINTLLEEPLKTGKINAAETLGAATSFMKLLDPPSVVRESELYLALKSTGVIDRLLNTYNTLKSGQVLTPTQVRNFTDAAKKLYDAAEVGHSALEKQYRNTAKEYGLNPNRAVPDYKRPGAGVDLKKKYGLE